MSEVDLIQLVASALRQVGGQTREFVRAEVEGFGNAANAVVAQTGRILAGCGLLPVEVLTSPSAPRVLIQGYAREGADTWAVLHVDRSGLGWIEMFSWFAATDAGLLTSQIGALRDEPRKHRFRSRCHGLDAPAVVQVHERRKTELAGTLGPALPVDASPSGFRHAMTDAVKRRLWA